MKKISICLCTFNGEKYLRKQLLSIFKQKNIENIGELIICDDFSIDNTVQVIQEFSNKEINLKLIQNNNRLGVKKNFEKCLKLSKYPIIVFCDQDDIWNENKLSRIINLKEIHEKKPVAVVHNASIINDQDQILVDDFMDLRGGFASSLVKNFYKNRYLGCCLAINCHLKEEIIPFPRFIPMHDIWIGIVVSIIGRTFFINENLTFYRRHPSNVTNASFNKQSAFIKILKYRLLFILCTFSIIIKKIRKKLFFLHLTSR